jgi:hypothetical protein
MLKIYRSANEIDLLVGSLFTEDIIDFEQFKLRGRNLTKKVGSKYK